jgi:O-antigen/teichoic acid export membrane protein
MSIIEQLAQPLILLAATPLLIGGLGYEQFGHFTIALTLTAMSPLLSLGTSALVVREIAHRLQVFPSTVHNALREALSVLLTMSALACMGACIFFSLRAQFMISPEAEKTHFVLVVGVGLGCAVAQEVDLLYAGAMKGLSRFGWSAAIEFGGRLIWLLAVVLGARAGGLEGALLAALVTLVVKAFAKGLFCAHLTRTPLVFSPSIDISGIRDLLRRSIWLWVQGLGGILLFSVDRFIVGGLFGVAVMGSYVACTQIAAVGLMVPAAAGQALVPWFTKHSANKSAPVRGWSMTLWALAFASAIPGLLISASSYLTLRLWLGSAIADSYWPVLAALAVGSAAVAAAVPFHFCLLSVGATRPIALANIAGGILGTLLCVALAKYGLTGFSLGKLAYAVPLAVLSYCLFRLLSGKVPVANTAQR